MTAVEAETMAPEAVAFDLRVADRCDASCGAQAFVAIGKEHLSLLFCAHHYHQYELALLAEGWSILVDTRDTLTNRPGDSA